MEMKLLEMRGSRFVERVWPPPRLRGSRFRLIRTAGPWKRLLAQTATSTPMQNPPQGKTAMSVKIFDGRMDNLKSARHQPPCSVFLLFDDGLSGVWSFDQLEIDMTDMKLATIKASTSGTSMEVESKWHDKVQIDSSSLRAAIDPQYKAELERAFLAIRGPIDDLIVTAEEP